jgi:hypothetical protein
MKGRKRVRATSVSSSNSSPTTPDPKVPPQEPANSKKAKFDRRYATATTSPEEVLGQSADWI